MNTFSQRVTLMIAMELFSTSCLCCLRMKRSQHHLDFSRHVLVGNLVVFFPSSSISSFSLSRILEHFLPQNGMPSYSLAVIDG